MLSVNLIPGNDPFQLYWCSRTEIVCDTSDCRVIQLIPAGFYNGNLIAGNCVELYKHSNEGAILRGMRLMSSVFLGSHFLHFDLSIPLEYIMLRGIRASYGSE